MSAAAPDAALREQVAKTLTWRGAHATFDDAIDGIPPEMRGARPDGVPYSAWELLEHLRITQRDILDFCVAESYRELEWPADYWPDAATPPDDAAWDRTVAAVRADRDALAALARDPGVDLMATVPHGSDQTYLREILLAADHNAYHVGELVLLRKLLGIWNR